MSETTSITILLPSGRLKPELMKKLAELVETYSLEFYLSTLQNIRLLNIPTDHVETIKNELAPLKVLLKAPGLFPIPRICVGKPHCNLGIIDTDELSNKILDHFQHRKTLKPKLKTSISACNLCCSNPKTTDLGIIATKKGLNLFVGGRGGPRPLAGKQILANATVEEVLSTMEKLFEYHEKKTKKKKRFSSLLTEEDFPFKEIK